MNWTLQHIEDLKAKGRIKDFVDTKPKPKPLPKIRAKDKVCYSKQFIAAHLASYCESQCVELVEEYKFSENRKFKFDWCIPERMIAVEYEGIFSRKSRHTTAEGYTKDSEKYNLATSMGYKVYRYTAKNYKNIINDLKSEFDRK